MINVHRIFWMLLAPNIVFALICLLVQSEQLIWMGNVAVLAGAFGVCVAYHKPVYDIMTDHSEMESADWLALGVFLSWMSVIFARAWSVAWRASGRPDWLANNQIIAYGLWMAIFASVFHLAAPGAIGNKRVPNQRWVKIGAWIALAVLVALAAGFYLDQVGILPKPAGFALSALAGG